MGILLSYSHPWSWWQIPTWWEYDWWEYAGSPICSSLWWWTFCGEQRGANPALDGTHNFEPPGNRNGCLEHPFLLPRSSSPNQQLKQHIIIISWRSYNYLGKLRGERCRLASFLLYFYIFIRTQLDLSSRTQKPYISQAGLQRPVLVLVRSNDCHQNWSDH